MNAILAILCFLVAVTVAEVPYGGGGPGFGHGGHLGGHGGHLGHGHAKAVDYYAVPKYTYSYGVDDHYTGDKKSAHETREGDLTKGQYTVLQPDGVLRTVNYVSDPVHGFQATVHNSAPAVHAVKKVVAPAYGHGHGGHGHPY